MYMIIGASGFLGSYVLDELLKTTKEIIVAVDINIPDNHSNNQIVWEKCNITNQSEIADLNRKYKYHSKNILFCSACHNPDYVETHFKEAWDVNIVALSFFVGVFENVNCFVYPSTDSVYGNSVDGYKFAEDSVLSPVNSYGKQKILAENIVCTYGYNVIRLPFMIGSSLAVGKQHFFDVITETLKKGESIEMFADSLRSTLSFRQVSRYIIKLMENYSDAPKILNICADDGLSKYELGVQIARFLGVSTDLVKPIYLGNNKTIFKTQRASSTLMDNSLAKQLYKEDSIKLNIEMCFNK